MFLLLQAIKLKSGWLKNFFPHLEALALHYTKLHIISHSCLLYRSVESWNVPTPRPWSWPLSQPPSLTSKPIIKATPRSLERNFCLCSRKPCQHILTPWRSLQGSLRQQWVCPGNRWTRNWTGQVVPWFLDWAKMRRTLHCPQRPWTAWWMSALWIRGCLSSQLRLSLRSAVRSHCPSLPLPAHQISDFWEGRESWERWLDQPQMHALRCLAVSAIVSSLLQDLVPIKLWWERRERKQLL